MSMTTLFLILFYGFAITAKTEDTKQSKRGIPESNGWIGIPNPHGYVHGHPWLSDTSWKGHKYPEFDLAHDGLYGGGAYGTGSGIPFGVTEPPYVKTIPIYITKHVILERPVPVPQPVYIEKPYHVPVEKVVPVPVERIIHKPVPVPVPVAKAVPVPVNSAIPIPINHPMPVPVEQAFAVPVPVPIPVPVHLPPNGIVGSGPVGPTVYYVTGYGGDHSHPPTTDNYIYIHGDGAGHESGHGYGHSPGHGFGPSYGSNFSYDDGHGHGRNYGHPASSKLQKYGHGQELKKRSKS